MTVQYYSPKRRAIYAQGEEINALEIFERDNWTCGICFGKIDRRVRYPAWKCATLDHIVPISAALAQGWPPSLIHTPENVQAAHRRCNEMKGHNTSTSPPV